MGSLGFNWRHYVPVLKGKQGEYVALEQCGHLERAWSVPLIEYVHGNRPVEYHAERIGRAWGTNPFYWDFRLVDDDDETAVPLLQEGFGEARKNGSNAVPVTGLDRSDAYQHTIATIMNEDGRGMCLRISPDYLPLQQDQVDQLLSSLDGSPQSTDLLIDLGDIFNQTPGLLTISCVNALQSTPHIADWRSLIIASGAYPSDASQFASNSVSTTPRNDWLLWTNLSAATVPRRPSFGDYGGRNPALLDLDPAIIRRSANIRYTTSTDWLVLKGGQIRTQGSGQYHQLCQSLIARPEYSGPTFSWGDQYIQECANQTNGPGNAQTWVQVPLSHHLKFAADQISNFPAS